MGLALSGWVAESLSNVANNLLLLSSLVRRWGIKIAMDYIKAEDEQTNFIDIGPVNKALNMLAIWADAGGKETKDFYK